MTDNNSPVSFKTAFLRPIGMIKSSRFWIPVISLSALIAIGSMIEEKRELSLIDRLYSQTTGTTSDNLVAPYISTAYWQKMHPEIERRLDYLNQRGINPSVPLIKAYINNSKNER